MKRLHNLFIIFVVTIQSKAEVSDDENTRQLNGDETESAAMILERLYQMRYPWTNNSRALMSITISILTDLNNISLDCHQQLQTILSDVLHYNGQTSTKSASLQMLDAFGKPPSGTAKGNRYWLGDVEQCVNAKVGINRTPGEYCLVAIYPNGTEKSLPPQYEISLSMIPTDYTSIKWGMCFPTTCSHDDKMLILNQDAKYFKMTVFINKILCQTSNGNVMDSVAATLTIIMLIPALIVIIATIHDCRQMTKYTTAKNQHAKMQQIEGKFLLICRIFSARTTFNSLVARPIISEGCSLTFLNGIRVLFAMGVIFSHVFMMMLAALPWKNQMDMYEVLEHPLMGLCSYGFFFINILFYLSAFFLSYLVFDDKCQLSNISDMLWLYFRRYIRITVPYLYAVLFITGPMPYISKGPIWPLSGRFSNRCRQNWFNQILYTQNVITDTVKEKCVPGEWYLAIDMQLYLLAVPFVWMLNRKPVRGIFCIITVIIVSTAALGISMAINEWSIFATVSTIIKTGNLSNGFQRAFERRFWYRTSSSGLGILVAYLITRHRNKIRLTKVVSICGFSVVGLCIVMLYVTANVYVDGQSMPQHLQIIFGTVGNLVWCSALSWIIIHCYFTPDGLLSKMLSFRLFNSLGKLSYSIYLVHGSVVIWRFLSLDTSRTLSYYQHWCDVAAVYALSLCGATVLYFVIESPTDRLVKMKTGRKVIANHSNI